MRSCGRPEREVFVVSIHAPRCRGAMRRTRRRTLPMSRFQSTPPVAEGRCRMAAPVRCSAGCFNPRPPLPRGDASGVLLRWGNYQVSIHAPRCRGAMRQIAQPVRQRRRFQSTPPVAEGRCDGDARLGRRGGDVSIHAPRCRGAMPQKSGSRSRPPNCFNPRPPLPRGDA